MTLSLPLGSSFLVTAGAMLLASPDDEVRRLGLEFTEAMTQSDTDCVRAKLAPGFVAVDTRGGVRRADEFVTDLQASPNNRNRSQLRREWRGVRVLVSGDQATFVGRAMWVPSKSGNGRATFSILYSQHWRLTDGRWKLAQLQRTDLPPLPEIVEVPSGSLRLKAMLFLPAGAGPFPAIVYAHGNEPDPSDLFERVGPALAARGYLVVAVHRRGSGLSADQGPNLLRRLTEIEQREGVDARSSVALAELEGPQLDDIAAAIAYARSRSEVDAARIFVVGNSFGGILALLAAERGLGLKGAADFAGAALNWDRSALFRERLSRAARGTKVPVFLAQAENDFSTSPTRELGRILSETGRPHGTRIYPAFGLTPGEGHSFGVDGVSIWLDEVMAFLDRAGAKEGKSER